MLSINLNDIADGVIRMMASLSAQARGFSNWPNMPKRRDCLVMAFVRGMRLLS
jgi:hypothetical protein